MTSDGPVYRVERVAYNCRLVITYAPEETAVQVDVTWPRATKPVPLHFHVPDDAMPEEYPDLAVEAFQSWMLYMAAQQFTNYCAAGMKVH